MRIEKILPPKEAAGPWILSLEDGQLFRVSEGEMIDFALHTGMELSFVQLQTLKAAGEVTALRDRAVSMLIGRPYSKGELRRKLMEKGTDEAQAEEIALWAEDIGLLNEEGYAKSIVRHYSARGYGRFKMKEVLYQRKIPKELWEGAMSELEAPEEAIDDYLRRHLHSMDQKSMKKAADGLARRGFSWREISEGMARFRLEED